MSAKNDEAEVELSSIDKPSGGGSKEDWAAAITGLVILAVALLGAIPKGWIY